MRPINLSPEHQAWIALQEENKKKYGGNPLAQKHGAGPEGTKCKTCKHLTYNHGAHKKYYKCRCRGITCGPATDHRVNWPACKLYEEAQ